MAVAADPDGSQRAAWTPKVVHFVFQGFTTKYSCEGLQAKVRSALLQLGARKDMRVNEGACWLPAGGPEPFPNVNVRMNGLRPVTGDAEDAHALAAHWQAIDLRLEKDPLW